MEPRLVVHVDEHAISAVGKFFIETLPREGVVLDLMSSWRSHMPEEFPIQRLVAVGLNAVEMEHNPQLDQRVVHDINADPALPFQDLSFDAAVMTVSVQYLTRPVEVFSEVKRILKDGAGFHVIYSNRMFPSKAVAVWQALDDQGRAELIRSYFASSGGWESPHTLDISPRPGFYTDPVYVVSGRKTNVGGRP